MNGCILMPAAELIRMMDPGAAITVFQVPSAHFCAAFTRFDPMISRWISLVPSYNRSSRTSR